MFYFNYLRDVIKVSSRINFVVQTGCGTARTQRLAVFIKKTVSVVVLPTGLGEQMLREGVVRALLATVELPAIELLAEALTKLGL